MIAKSHLINTAELSPHRRGGKDARAMIVLALMRFSLSTYGITSRKKTVILEKTGRCGTMDGLYTFMGKISASSTKNSRKCYISSKSVRGVKGSVPYHKFLRQRFYTQ